MAGLNRLRRSRLLRVGEDRPCLGGSVPEIGAGFQAPRAILSHPPKAIPYHFGGSFRLCSVALTICFLQAKLYRAPAAAYIRIINKYFLYHIYGTLFS